MRAALGFGAALLLAGCAPPSPPPTTSATSTVATATASPTAGGDATPTVPLEPPAPPTAPAPTTAGTLDETDVARPEGWSPTARPGSVEDGYLGNGTWVHAVSPEHAALGAIALGCAELGPYPRPVAALEGTLTGPEGRPGIGLTLEFGDERQARAYFDAWVDQAEACVGTATTPLSRSEDTWLGRRNLDTVWSEAVGWRGTRVVLLIVDSPEADLATALPAG